MSNLAVFVSGKGSNFNAILSSLKDSSNKIEIKVIAADKECPAIKIARKNNIPVYFISLKSKDGFVNYNELIKIFMDLDINLIVLAGFLKKIPDNFVELYFNKIINIHPALLPSFGGKGMYGMNVHRAVFNSSAQVSGATVHFVNKKYDDGKIIAQRTVSISDVKTPEEIAERVLKIEHQLLPFVIKKFTENKIFIENNRVYIHD